jgi:ABC-type multidrug transport system fused ATPase/permease subunit
MVWLGTGAVSHGEMIRLGRFYHLYHVLHICRCSYGQLPRLYANLQKAVGASERVLEILAEKGEDIPMVESNNNAIDQPIKGDLLLIMWYLLIHPALK